MVSPLEMPPWMPPERFVRVRTWPAFMRKGSLCCKPVSRMPPKPEPMSKPFEAGQAQHGFGQLGFESVEDRFAPAGRHAAGHAFNNATHAVAGTPPLLDKTDHLFGRGLVGTTDDVGFDVAQLHFLRVNIGDEPLHL